MERFWTTRELSEQIEINAQDYENDDEQSSYEKNLVNFKKDTIFKSFIFRGIELDVFVKSRVTGFGNDIMRRVNIDATIQIDAFMPWGKELSWDYELNTKSYWLDAPYTSSSHIRVAAHSLAKDIRKNLASMLIVAWDSPATLALREQRLLNNLITEQQAKSSGSGKTRL